jgi:hypothetical protein
MHLAPKTNRPGERLPPRTGPKTNILLERRNMADEAFITATRNLEGPINDVVRLTSIAADMVERTLDLRHAERVGDLYRFTLNDNQRSTAPGC